MSSGREKLEQLLAAITDSIIKISLVVFFHRNQGALDSAEGLARWVGKKTEEVERALAELTDVGIVDKIGEGRFAAYSYTQDEEMIRAIEEFVMAMARENGALQKTVNLLRGD
ncbi:MAG: hypothetical protein K6T80_08030 [Firmicutes bacterium]|nr:hypothetical protein [Bacillota bacterium]